MKEFKIGQHVRFDILDYRDLTYEVEAVECYERVIGNEAFFFTDYVLNSEDSSVKRLRQGFYFCLLLSLFDEIPFNADFQRVVDEAQGRDYFNIDEEDKRFYRLDELEGPYLNVPVVDVVTRGLLRTISYWDYSYEGKDEAGQPFRELLMIERNEATGLFQLWRGFEIDHNSIW